MTINSNASIQKSGVIVPNWIQSDLIDWLLNKKDLSNSLLTYCDYKLILRGKVSGLYVNITRHWDFWLLSKSSSINTGVSSHKKIGQNRDQTRKRPDKISRLNFSGYLHFWLCFHFRGHLLKSHSGPMHQKVY